MTPAHRGQQARFQSGARGGAVGHDAEIVRTGRIRQAEPQPGADADPYLGLGRGRQQAAARGEPSGGIGGKPGHGAGGKGVVPKTSGRWGLGGE